MLFASAEEGCPMRRTALVPGVFLALAFIPSVLRAEVTYNKDIAPIIYKNCSSCHRAGEVAPFSLLTYKDAVKHAKQLEVVTQSRYMPPWKPEPAFGEFQDTRHLSDSEIALIKRWVDSGAPEGKASDLPKSPAFIEGWQLGQ